MVAWRTALILTLALDLASCASLPSILKGASPEAQQVVLVVPRGGAPFQATLSAWERMRGGWRRVLGPWSAVIGRNGLAPAGEKREGDGRTPTGVYSLGMAFGREQAVPTRLQYRQSTAGDFWVDDVASPQYNQWVRGAPQAASFETMLRSDGLYDIGVVIEYNSRPVVPGLGSAIFLHIWRDGGVKPTAGCVALERSRLRQLVEWLDAGKSPVILLGDGSR